MKKDFIAISDYTPGELQGMLDLAVELKKEWKAGGNRPVLKDKLSPAEIGLGKRESIADVARVISGYVDVVMARVFEHAHVTELAKWSSIPVINGLSDFNHPCQGMADALTVLEEFGTLKDKNITFIGDGNNVAVSLMFIAAKLGAHFTLAAPEGYDMPAAAVETAQGFATESGSRIKLVRDPGEAVTGADVLYTDTWTSMGQEEEARKREQAFASYQVNEGLVAKAKPETIVMHCLPAHRGQEITDAVADGPHSRLFPQAHNRLHAQKAILVHLLEEA